MNSLSCLKNLTIRVITPRNSIYILSSILFAFIYFPSFAQQNAVQVSGSVVDSETKSPLPGANVYIQQSTINTTTSDIGRFSLKFVSGNYNLIVSYVGYKTFVAPVSTIISNEMAIELVAEPKTLEEVNISADPSRIQNLTLFKSRFIGTNAPYCVILNPDVLIFKNKDSLFTAEASKPLVIENRWLGYKLYYDLVSFKHYPGRTSYVGYSRFEELPAKNNKEKKEWRANRTYSYLGSSSHFMYALVNNTVKKNGFIIKKLTKTRKPPAVFTIVGQWPEYVANPTDTIVTLTQALNGNSFGNIEKNKNTVEFNVRHPGEVLQKTILSKTSTPNIYKLYFDNSLLISYKKKNKSPAGGNIFSLEDSFTSSIITILMPNVYLDKFGNLSNPNAILFKGYWGGLHIANQLSVDYSSN